MTIARRLLLASALAAPTGAFAQVIPLEEIIVSAGLTPVASDAYGRANTVLTRADIEARGAVTVQDALRGVPGVAISGAGLGFTDVRIRGGEANNTLILVDGIDVSGGSGQYILSGLTTADVERIEVLRGPQTVYYGANASSGVINIITDKGAQGLHYGTSVEVGSGETASAHVSRRTDRGGVSLNVTSLDDHGFDQSGDGRERDGIRRKTIGLAGDWKATETLTFGSTLRWSKEENDYDAENYDFVQPPTNADDFVVDADLMGARREFQGGVWGQYDMLGARLTHRIDYQDTVFKQRSDGTPFARGEAETLKYRLSYGLDGRPADQARHLLNLLVERREDGSSVAPEYERDRNSYAVEYRAFLENGLDLQGGVRRDDNKVFDDFDGWNLGLSWRVPGQPIRLHASAGRGQVDPIYSELFDTPFSIGNPSLTPERNRSYDLGVEWTALDGRGSIDVTYFNERLEDEITYAFIPTLAAGTYVNADGESPREGVEISGKLQATDNMGFSLNYTYLDAKTPDGTVEVRRPRHEVLLSSTLSVLQDRGQVTATVRHVAGNNDTEFWGTYAVTELPDYTTLDLTAGYDLTEQVRLTGRVMNVFDKEYSDVWGYATRDRTAYMGVQARW